MTIQASDPDYYHTVPSLYHADVSSGPLFFRFVATSNLNGQLPNGRFAYVTTTGNTISGELDMSYHKLPDTSWNIDLSYSHSTYTIRDSIRNNEIPDGSAVHFQLFQELDVAGMLAEPIHSGSVAAEVTISKESFYDLPASIEMRIDPAGSIGTGVRASSPPRAARFAVGPASRGISGDVMKQHVDLHLARNIVLDVCGGTGFSKFQTHDASWVTDLSWATYASAWKGSVPLDVSDQVYPGRGTSRVELSLSGEHVFDISDLKFRVHLRVPGATEAASIPDVSLDVIDLSKHVGNLASLQRVDVLESNPGGAARYRTVYNTPDVMYATGTGGVFSLYRDRAKSKPITDISYFIVNRPYYFYNLEGTPVLFTGVTPTRVSDGSLVYVKWSGVGNTSMVNGGVLFPGGTIPVVADLSLALVGEKNKGNVKWLGGTDSSAELLYRFAFSTHKPTELAFDGAERLDLSAMHFVASASSKPVDVSVVDLSTVDVSFVIGVAGGQMDVSLDDLFVTSKLGYLGLGDVSGAKLPAVKYPGEYVYQLPTEFSYNKVGNKWTGIVTLSDGSDPQTVINHLYDNDYMDEGNETHRTAFDVNQPTNYVEISLNQVLPSGVSAEWFSDASFVQYSTYTGALPVPDASWMSVSFDRGTDGMIRGATGQKDTIRFSICGECLDSHNLYLKQHVLRHDTLDKSREIIQDTSFTIDLSDHLMKQPVFEELRILDHKTMTYKEPKDVSYVVNVHGIRIVDQLSDGTRNVVGTHANSRSWETLYDFSCVGRFRFREADMGAHNSISGSNYLYNSSMSYKKPTVVGDVHSSTNVTLGASGESFIDICGQLQHNVHNALRKDISMTDISFGLMIRRSRALSSQNVDVSAVSRTLSLRPDQIWQIPTDVSWVHAKTSIGLLTLDKDLQPSGKFTNVHTVDGDADADLSYHIQTITLDFSGGYFPNNRRKDFVKDISYSIIGSTADGNFGFYAGKQIQSRITDISNDIIPGEDGRLRRITFDISKSAINYSSMWLQFRLIGPDEKYYYIIKSIKHHIEAKQPPQQFTIWPLKTTGSYPYDPNVHGTSLAFYERQTNDFAVTEIDGTLQGRFNRLEDMSLTFFHKETTSTHDAIWPNIDLSYDVSYQTYNEFVTGGGTGYIPKRRCTIVPGSVTDKSFNTFISWRDLSKGNITSIVFYADLSGYDPDGVGAAPVELRKDMSATFLEDNIVQYVPPKSKNSITDVSSYIFNLPLTSGTEATLITKQPGKWLSLMASGEVSIPMDIGISYDMLPADVGSSTSPGYVSTKASIQRAVQRIDISYETHNNSLGLLSQGTTNDVSCVPGWDVDTNTVASKNILFNFDASADAAALAKYAPHNEPTDLSINLTFYTDLTHTDTSTITWVVPKDNIDWLNPPTKFKKEERKTRYLEGNADIATGAQKDMSWSNVRDTSMTVILDRKFHAFFPRRYLKDFSGQVHEAKLTWVTDIGSNPRYEHPVDIGPRLRCDYDQSYVQFDLSWQDFSKGVPRTGDASSLYLNLKVLNTRHLRGAANTVDISFGISYENIEHYKAPKDGDVRDISCLVGPSQAPLTDFSMTTLYRADQSLNLVFDISAFGDLYLSTSSPTWQPRLEDVVSSISYDWLHNGTYKEIFNQGRLRTDCSFLPRSLHGHNHDVIQVPIRNDDVSNTANPVEIRASDPSAMHFSIAVYRDRAKTPALVRCISMGIAGSDISTADIRPTKVVRVQALRATSDVSFSIFGGGTPADLQTEISFNVVVDSSFDPIQGTVSSDFIAHHSGKPLSYRWRPWEDAYNGGAEKWHTKGVSDVSINLNSNKMSFKLDASDILLAGRVFDASTNLFDISLHFLKDDQSSILDISLVEKPDAAQIERYKYPKGIADISSTIRGTQFADLSMTTLYDSSVNVIIDHPTSAFPTLAKYGKIGNWKASDLIKDASLTVFPEAGTEYPVSFTNSDMSLVDASTIALNLRSDDVSQGYIGTTGRIEISMNFYTDISKTDDYKITALNVVRGEDISYYRPPIRYVSTSTKAAWANVAPGSVQYFADSSLSLWVDHDISLLVQFDKPFHSEVSSNVIFDLSYIHDFCGNNITTSNESLASTIDISRDDMRFVTVRLSKDDLSAGIPVEKVANAAQYTGNGQKDISFVTRAYRDRAKTPSLATDITLAINERDISYYRPPLWFRDNTNKIDVSCQTHAGSSILHEDGHVVKLCTLIDTSVNLTISMDVLKGSINLINSVPWNDYGFPNTTFHDWIHDISFRTNTGNNFINTMLNKDAITGRTTGDILPSVDGSNLRIKIGMNSSTLRNEYITEGMFNLCLYSDKSKSSDRTFQVQTVAVGPNDISQVADVTHFTFADTIETDAYDLDLRKRPTTDPKIGVKLIFNAPITESTKWKLHRDTRLMYRVRDKNDVDTSWTETGITQNNQNQTQNAAAWGGYGLSMDIGTGNARELDISLDPTPIIWSNEFYTNKGTRFNGGGDVFDFSLHLWNGSTFKNIRELNSAASLGKNIVNYFYVHPVADSMDVSSIGLVPKYQFSLLKNDLSINVTPSGEHLGEWDTTFYFDDISHHVRDVSWTYTYNAGAGPLSVAYNYDLSANVMTKVREGAADTTRGYSWWTTGHVKRLTEDVQFDGKDASGLQLGMFNVANDLSKGEPVSFKVEMSIYNDLSYTRGGRTTTTVTKTITDINKFERYIYPKSFTISSESVAGVQFHPDHKFSNLHDMSVNLDLSFGPEYSVADNIHFAKHPSYAEADFANRVISDISFQWNDGPRIRVSDISVVRQDRVQFRVLQNDISTYPVQGISFNVIFYKDVAKTSTFTADISRGTAATEISSVVLPRITKFEALDHNNNDTPYTDCSLSLIDRFKSTGYRHMAKCRITLDRPLDDPDRVRFDTPTSQSFSTRSITYEVSYNGSNFDNKEVGKYEDTLQTDSNGGTLRYDAAKMYNVGIPKEDISASAGSRHVDFSINTAHVLMGLIDANHASATNEAVTFHLKMDTKVNPDGTVTRGNDISDVPFTLKFSDISYYDGSYGIESKAFGVGNTATTGIPDAVVQWGGSPITPDTSFSTVLDCSMRLNLPLQNGFNFKTRPSAPTEFLDFSMIVHDICINYPTSSNSINWESIKGHSDYGFGKVTGSNQIEFKIRAQPSHVVNRDISIVVHLNHDLCGNGLFVGGDNIDNYIDVSYVIPFYGVRQFEGPIAKAVEKGYLAQSPSTLLGSKKLTMRADTSLNILLTFPVAPDGHGMQDISSYVYVYDMSYAWNSKLSSTVWKQVPVGNIKESTVNGTDISMQIRIPHPSKAEHPYVYGDFSLNMWVRKHQMMNLADFDGEWRPGGDKVVFQQLSVPESDISAHYVTLRLDSDTTNGGGISGEGTTLYGYNIQATNKWRELDKVDLHQVQGTHRILYKSQTTLQGPQKFLHMQTGTSTMDISTETPNVYGELWKRDIKIRSLIYAGRCQSTEGDDDQIVHFAANDPHLGLVSNQTSTETFQTTNWNGHVSTTINYINNKQYSNSTWASTIANIAPYPAPFKTMKNDARNRCFIMGFNLTDPIDLSLIKLSKRNVAYLQDTDPTTGSSMFGLQLREEAFGSLLDLSNACREYIHFMGFLDVPKLKLTKNTNIANTLNVGSSTGFRFGLVHMANWMFDISSDMSLNMDLMTRYHASKKTTYFTVGLATPPGTYINIYPNTLTASQQGQSGKTAGGSATYDMSASFSNISVDTSDNTRRFLIMQDDESARVLNLGGNYANVEIRDISAHNVYTTDGGYFPVLEVSMNRGIGTMDAANTGLLTYSAPGS